MHEEILRAQQDNALTPNYNRWMFDTIRPYIGNRVMDIGAGMGNFLHFLSEKESVVAIEILDVFIDALRKSYGGYKNIHILKYDIQDDNLIQIAGGYGIETVICNNVLEHVQDDLKALDNINKVLDGRGNLILVLPAFKFLFSRWDRAVGHFRRYDLKDITEKLKQANFYIEVKFYMNSIGLFAWFLNGRVFKNTPNTGGSVRKQAVFFDRYIVNYLKKLENIWHPPFGQSLLIIARPAAK